VVKLCRKGGWWERERGEALKGAISKAALSGQRAEEVQVVVSLVLRDYYRKSCWEYLTLFRVN
jgi:hypothetical protein